ncbi:hypothetical protein [Lysinibacillus xylanilyticus]|nr:hypothetical protein [Lysinibacillus xylanilyticus]
MHDVENPSSDLPSYDSGFVSERRRARGNSNHTIRIVLLTKLHVT